MRITTANVTIAHCTLFLSCGGETLKCFVVARTISLVWQLDLRIWRYLGPLFVKLLSCVDVCKVCLCVSVCVCVDVRMCIVRDLLSYFYHFLFLSFLFKLLSSFEKKKKKRMMVYGWDIVVVGIVVVVFILYVFLFFNPSLS